MRTPTAPAAPKRPHSDLRALIVALLLFAATVGFVSACGSGDLIFPGMIPATPTDRNTATPVPENQN
jgi:hypothetical protein